MTSAACLHNYQVVGQDEYNMRTRWSCISGHSRKTQKTPKLHPRTEHIPSQYVLYRPTTNWCGCVSQNPSQANIQLPLLVNFATIQYNHEQFQWGLISYIFWLRLIECFVYKQKNHVANKASRWPLLIVITTLMPLHMRQYSYIARE